MDNNYIIFPFSCFVYNFRKEGGSVFESSPLLYLNFPPWLPEAAPIRN
nr:MAG TPA: hypothetical protein [Inoviridae sp.]